MLDVPEGESTVIAFGVLLRGAGEVWVADVRLDTVGQDVATTGRVPLPLPAAPVNLAFAE